MSNNYWANISLKKEVETKVDNHSEKNTEYKIVSFSEEIINIQNKKPIESTLKINEVREEVKISEKNEANTDLPMINDNNKQSIKTKVSSITSSVNIY